MLKRVSMVAVVVIAALAAFVATRPGAYGIERSIATAAPPEVAYAQVADLHRWEAWSPWAKLDPAMRSEYGGTAAGEGATYHWAGNSKAGEGRMTVTRAQPASEVVIRLEFLEPMEDTAVTTFRFTPQAGGTQVTWRMEGKLGFVGKAMCLVKSMDRMIGPDFERGLAALKAVAESEAGRSAASAP
jgi:hypothetical protein